MFKANRQFNVKVNGFHLNEIFDIFGTMSNMSKSFKTKFIFIGIGSSKFVIQLESQAVHNLYYVLLMLG